MRFHSPALYVAACIVGSVALAASPLTAFAQSPGIDLTATSHNFVSVAEGTSQKYGIRLTNKSGKPFPFDLSLTGSGSFTSQTDCPKTVADGAACEIVFTYKAPATSQWEEAKFTIADNGVPFTKGNTGTLRAHAVAAGVITLNTQKHNFGTVEVGKEAQKFGLNIANGASTAVPFSYKAAGEENAYKVESNCPASLPAGAQCSIVFAFKPTAKGWQNLTVTLDTGTVEVAGGKTITLVGAGS